jgi:guanine deaminase
MEKKSFMKLGINMAFQTMLQNTGGPFGAVIVKDEQIITIASNRVLGDHDPTAHAEITAIRQAGKILGTHDLSGCELYATGYPCPMCLSAIIWANIKKVYYGCTPKDAEKIGFRDDFIYNFINNGCSDENTLKIIPLDRDNCLCLFNEYEKNQKEIY